MVRTAKNLVRQGVSLQGRAAKHPGHIRGEVGEEKSFAEIMEAKVERSKDRAERHREYADNAAQRSEGCMNSAHQILDIIPPGQPILVGHHFRRLA